MSDKLLQQIRGLGFLQKITLFLEFSSELYREAHNTAGMPVGQKFDVLKLTDEERRKRFGRRLKLLRQALGLRQADLAAMLETPPQVISVWEVGKQEPSLKRLIMLAQELKVSTDLLLGIERKNVAEQDKKMEAGAYV